MNWKEFGRKHLWLIRSILLAFAWTDWGKLLESTVDIASDPEETRTENFTNDSQEDCRYANPPNGMEKGEVEIMQNNKMK
jgi:hypothetical protein